MNSIQKIEGEIRRIKVRLNRCNSDYEYDEVYNELVVFQEYLYTERVRHLLTYDTFIINNKIKLQRKYYYLIGITPSYEDFLFEEYNRYVLKTKGLF